MNKIKILVCGSAGKMGSSIIRLANGDEQVQITGAVDLGDDFDSPASKADVIVDFTTPASTIEHLSGAKKSKKAIVIGTTGFDATQLEKIKEASAIIPWTGCLRSKLALRRKPLKPCRATMSR